MYARHSRPLLLVFAAATLAGLSATAPGGAQAGSTPLREWVQGERGVAIDRHVSRLAAFGISGALYVQKDGKVLVERGYGLADWRSRAPIRSDSPFLIGSLSKQFTAAAILALEADGRLTTADTLGRFFPEAPPSTRRITVHQLLAHTSGLPYLTERPFFETRPRDSVMREMLELPTITAPGEKHAYSNPGYVLLAGVIERASGRRFEDYLGNRIFARAGLASTRCLEPSLRDTADLLVVHSYSGAEDEGTMLPLRAMSKSVGAGSVISTAADLGRWAAALANDRVLPEAQRAKLFAPHATVNPTLSYGYGWNVVKTSRGTTMFSHAGDLGGWNVEMRIDRDADLVLVFLSNRRLDGKGSRGAVMNPVTLLATGAAVPELPAVRDPRPAELDSLAGRYAFAEGGALVATARDGSLEVAAEDAAAFGRLAGDDAAPPESLAIEAKTRTLAEAMARREWTVLPTLLHPSLPANEAAVSIDSTTTGAERRLGKLQRVEVIGAVATGPGSALSFARVHRERGTTLLRLGWVNGRVLGFDADAAAVLPTRFLPAEDGEWINVDPFTARVTRLTVDRDPGGRVVALGLAGGSGARARRVG